LAVPPWSIAKVSTSSGSQPRGSTPYSGCWLLSKLSIIGAMKSNNSAARASMRWRSVGLDGSRPMPSACL
jgi:hypothetical protein